MAPTFSDGTLPPAGVRARTADAADRRRATITITGPGIEILRRSMRSRESWLTQALITTLCATERELLRLTATLIDRLADADE